MSIEERRLNIALQLANNATNQLVATLAAREEEIEKLQARVAELEPKPKEKSK